MGIYFTIKLFRIKPPSHIFTEEEIKEVLRPRAMTVWTIMIMARKIPRNGKPRMRSRTSRTLMGAAQKKMMRTV